MSGAEVKEKLMKGGYILKDVADAMGIIPQNLQSLLNADDIKTGVLEKIAQAISKSIYFFYDTILLENSPNHDKRIEWLEKQVEELIVMNKNLIETNKLLATQMS